MAYKCADEFRTWADSYLNFEKTPKKNIFWLETMKFLMEKLGNPQDKIPCIHVAGSKGKGSISALISSILREMDFKTGVYTSPHMTDFLERIGNGVKAFDEEVYKNAGEKVRKTIEALDEKDFPEGRSLTWFEIISAYGMECFFQADCDWNVFEVGLGGRLDATNIIKPKICLIGPIELEHTEYLGDTLEKIAFEKGGIIKEGVPVLIYPQKKEVKEVFKNIAEQRKAPVYFADEELCVSVKGYKKNERAVVNNKNERSFLPDFSPYFMETEIKSKYFTRPLKAEMRLLGSFQAWNAALAALAAKILFPSLSEDVIEKGLSKASLQGRFECIANPFDSEKKSSVILDGAHTLNSTKLTMETYRQLYDDKGILLFACAADKDVKDMTLFFKDSFSSVYITKPGNTKACDLNAISNAFDFNSIPYTLDADFKKQILTALKEAGNKKKNLLITGSFYLVAEAKLILQNL